VGQVAALEQSSGKHYWLKQPIGGSCVAAQAGRERFRSIHHAEVRDPQLFGWPKEALTELAAGYDRVYRDVSSKFGLVAHDGPQNQIESNTALLPAQVESEAN
jgi:hypothetical protein